VHVLKNCTSSKSWRVCLIQRQNSRYFRCPVWKTKRWWKSKPTWKMKHANSILESFEHLSQISSKSILLILSYTVSKLVHFLRHSVGAIISHCTWHVDNLDIIEMRRHDGVREIPKAMTGSSCNSKHTNVTDSTSISTPHPPYHSSHNASVITE